MNGYIIAAIATALFGGGFYLGGLHSDNRLANYKTAVEAQHAAQLQAVANVLTQHDEQAAAERAAQQKVIDAYDQEKSLAPITTGIVQRMRIVEAASCGAGDRQLSGAGPVASGAATTGAIPRSDPEGDRLLQAALDAADSDADQLNAVIKLAPKRKP